jgi:hypothetical protein
VTYGGYQIVARFYSFSFALDFAFLLLILPVSKKSQNRAKNLPTKKALAKQNPVTKNLRLPTPTPKSQKQRQKRAAPQLLPHHTITEHTNNAKIKASRERQAGNS